MRTEFGFGKRADCSFDDAVERVTEALARQGFGILTVIDVQATFKAKRNSSRY